jgi:hypothetical protein
MPRVTGTQLVAELLEALEKGEAPTPAEGGELSPEEAFAVNRATLEAVKDGQVKFQCAKCHKIFGPDEIVGCDCGEFFCTATCDRGKCVHRN